MIKLKNILLQESYSQDLNRSKPISMESAIKIIKDNDFINIDRIKQVTIYRGIREIYNNNTILTVDPKLFNRTSRNTFNYYTLIIDNSDSWKDFPKRSKSIICSANENDACEFSPGSPYIVIPLEKDCVFGVCSSSDLWMSFRNTIPPNLLDITFINVIHILFKITASKLNIELNEPKTIDELYKLFNYVDLVKKDDSKLLYYKILDLFDTYTVTFWSTYFENDITLKNFSNNILDPKKNNFKTLKYWDSSDSLDKTKEVWTDSECLLIKEIEFEKIFGQEI